MAWATRRWVRATTSASNTAATVGGGRSNTASGFRATVGGGESNIAAGTRAIVGGGRNNRAPASYATVPGGRDNKAGGNYSFAAGRRAKVRDATTVGGDDTDGDEGSFVWADSEDADFESTGPDQFLLRAAGGVGLGTNSPTNQLHVTEAIDGAALVGNHVALIENTALTTDNGPDVLALKTSAPNPGNLTKFITFFDASNTALGHVEGDGSGGVHFTGTSADFAEMLPRLEAGEQIAAGEVVGVYGGRITRRTEGAEQLMVVTDRAIVLGNNPGDGARAGYEAVSFVGQVPVWVRGTVESGDVLVASGLEDGFAVGVALARYDVARHGTVLGRAWGSSSGGERRVNAVLGVDEAAALRAVVARQQALIDGQQAAMAQQQAEIEVLRTNVAELDGLLAEMAALRALVEGKASAEAGRGMTGASRD